MDLLNPRGAAPEQAVLGAWLAVQRRYALKPQHLPAAFRKAAAKAASAEEAHAALSRLLHAHGVAPLTKAELSRALKILERAEVQLLPIASPLYPPRFARLNDAPPLLHIRGQAAWLRARSVAIVGARAATLAGRDFAAQLSGAFARAGLVVVSGLARGIDAGAHRAALAAGGATVAFQACSPEHAYPPEHRALTREIIAKGAVASEFPVATPPLPPYFPLRNRLISAISEAVIIVEARGKSGSLTTAAHAANQGVEVWAVPGTPGRPTSEGPLRLLRDGANIVTAPQDVLDSLGLKEKPAAANSNSNSNSNSAAADAPADSLQGRMCKALEEEPRDADELGLALGESAGEITAALVALELSGRVGRDRDGRYSLRNAG